MNPRERANVIRVTPRLATLISLLRRLFGLAHRFPWLLPALSFVAGWLGFLLVQRGQVLARIVALLSLLGWFWLLLEPWVRLRPEEFTVLTRRADVAVATPTSK